jgi:hypothetical protein
MRDWFAPQRKLRSIQRVEGKAGGDGAGAGLGTERYLSEHSLPACDGQAFKAVVSPSSSRAGVPARHLDRSERKEWRAGTPTQLSPLAAIVSIRSR